MWGLTQREEWEVLRVLVAPAEVDPLPSADVEVDEFSFHYTATEKPHIQNDTFTSEPFVSFSLNRFCCVGAFLKRGSESEMRWKQAYDAESLTYSLFLPIDKPKINNINPPTLQNNPKPVNYRLAGDHLIKMSISHALAQSTKLSVYEERVMAIVEETKGLPELMAATGQVRVGRKEVAQLIGRVFLQKSAVNLLSTVLDTPEASFSFSCSSSFLLLFSSSCFVLSCFWKWW
jgi:uncharacterized Rmd1/YagE family protein